MVLLPLLIGVAIVTAAEQTAQTPPPTPAAPGQVVTPARDAARPAPDKKATAIIRGRVTAADSGTPLRRVTVRATGPELRAGAMTLTDDQGRFEIKELPAGRYTVIADKGGFVPMQYGQRRPGAGSGTPLDLSDGQMVDRVNVALVRGGAITGRVLDDAGEPLVRVDVLALRYGYVLGRRQLTPTTAVDQTDDDGVFRLHSLPAGDYFVRAIADAGAGTGQSNTFEALTPTFYPGTVQMADAQRVAVKAGQVTPNVSFAVSTAKPVRVSGQVLGSQGLPLSIGQIAMSPRDDARASLELWKHSASLRPDGTFQFRNVMPGQYAIRVLPAAAAAAGANARDEFARVDITVSGTDVDNLLIVTGPAGIARGRVVTDEGTPPPLAPARLRLFTTMADPEMDVWRQSFEVKINDDWTFEIARVVEPVIVRQATGPGGDSGWSLRRVQHDGADLTDRGIAVPPGGVLEGMEIVLTRKVTEASGQVTDDRGRPVTDATIVVFASNRERWTPGSRYVRTARPDPTGAYRVRLVPDEEYLIVAVRDLEDGQSGDPEFLDRASAAAARFSIADGEQKSVSVKVSPLQP